MARKPVVSIVGRPNVGKSSLFNRMVGARAAVVHGEPGVTRDRHYREASWDGTSFVAVDTGGLVPNAREAIPSQIRRQVDLAVEESALVVFVVDAQVEPTDLDLMIARRLLRSAGGRIVAVANKAESTRTRFSVGTYASLGTGEPIAVSALHGQGVGDLLDRIVGELKRGGGVGEQSPDTAERIRVAIVGRPNAGKSSLVNRLLKKERMIVDNVPGTTRDAVDSFVKHRGEELVLIDTAGLRRKSRIRESTEYYSTMRAIASIQRCDVAVVMVDSVVGLQEQDLKIVERVVQQRRGVVLCWTKWDAREKDPRTFDQMVAEARRRYMELRHVPAVSISSVTGQRVTTLLDLVMRVRGRMSSRIAPSVLKDDLRKWVRASAHPQVGGKPVKIMGVKQRRGSPPTFVFFATNPSLVTSSYRRYLSNKLHDSYDLDGCPIALHFGTPARSGARTRATPP